MEINSENIEERFEPKTGIVIYKSNNDKNTEQSEKYYIEEYAFIKSKNDFLPCCPKPLAYKKFERLINSIGNKTITSVEYSFFDQEKQYTILFSNVSVLNFRLIIHVPSKTRTINIAFKDFEKKYTFKCPDMIFDFRNGEFYSYMINMLQKDCLLYDSPFFNTYKDNRVCTGNFKFEERYDSLNEAAEEMIKFFFDTQFNACFNDKEKEFKEMLIGAEYPISSLKTNKELEDLWND